MFPKLRLLVLSVILSSASALAGPAPTIYMVGDSTMSNYPTSGDNPQRGWGQYVEELFTGGVKVENHAAAGRSTKSFQTENRWRPVVDKLQAGDWVIIQFGHNDQKKDKPDVYAPADTDYKTNLTKFVKDTQAKGANPIIATSIYRLYFDEAGKPKSTAGAYPQAARDVAKELNVPLVDLHKLTEAQLAKLGEEGAKPYFLFYAAGEVKSHPEGKSDKTHLNEKGAKWIAGLFAQGLRETKAPLADSLKPDAGK